MLDGMTATSVASIAGSMAMRIAPDDSNYFVLLFDKAGAGVDTVMVVEIFERGGATPPNSHLAANEFFYVLAGTGIARCGGEEIALSKGSAMLVRPGSEHVVVNTGAGKLYTLTMMVPNEGFAELIRAGIPVQLDQEDLDVLCG